MLALLVALVLHALLVTGDVSDRIFVPRHAVDLAILVRRMLERDVKCKDMPSRTIMMTATTYTQFDLILKQREALHALYSDKEDRRCILERKLIVVCLDHKCLRMCHTHKVPHCARFYATPHPHRRIETTPPPSTSSSTSSSAEAVEAAEAAAVVASAVEEEQQQRHYSYYYKLDSQKAVELQEGTYRTQNWYLLTFVKWEFISIAEKEGAELVLMYDADVLLLTSPFVAAHDALVMQVQQKKERMRGGNEEEAEGGGRGGREGSRDGGKMMLYDVLHAAENSEGSGGGGVVPATGGSGEGSPNESAINSGLMFLRTSTQATKDIIASMLAKRNEIVPSPQAQAAVGGGGEVKLEQEVLQGIIRTHTNATRHTLSRRVFTSHCQYAHFDDVPVREIGVYHCACATGTAEKLQLMSHFLRVSVRYPHAKFNQAEASRWYFDSALTATDPDKPREPLPLD